MAGERALGEIADISQGRYLPPERMHEHASPAAPIPIWGARGVIGYTDTPSYTFPVPLVTCRGNGCGLVQWTGGPANISNNAMAVVPRTTEPRDARFLYYSLLSTDFGDVTTGSAQPQITIGHLSQKPVFWPEISHERAAIAHILGTLDDKIELNRRMSETLEAMARALFKSWFIDFLPVRAKMAAEANDPSLYLPQAEPGTWYVYAIECNDGSLYIGQTEDLRQRWLQHVGGKGASWTKSHLPVQVAYWEKQPSREAAVERENWLKTGFGRKWLKKEIAARTQTGDPVRAKMEGRWQRGESLPGLPAHLYDLFPDRLVDSELGEIPEGWEVGTLADVLGELVSGGRPKGGAAEEGVPSVGAENVIGLGKYDFSKEKYVPREFFNELQRKGAAVRPGDVLLYKDGAQIGRKTYFDCGFPHADCAVNEHVFIVRAKRPHYQRYLFFWLDQHWMTQEIISLNSNSAQPGINQQGVRSLPFLMAPDPVVALFDHISKTLTERLFAACHESRTLAAVRDALLPKLISGELRLPAALCNRTAQAGVKDAERFIASISAEATGAQA